MATNRHLHQTYLLIVLLLVVCNLPLWLQNEPLLKLNNDVSNPFPSGEKDSTTTTIVWTGLGEKKSFHHFLQRYWKANLFCKTIPNNTAINLDIQLGSCQAFLDQSFWGTGNVLTGLYGLRLAALQKNVDWQISCEEDAMDTRTELILPWVMGKFEADSAFRIGVNNSTSTCSTFDNAPIGLLADSIQFDMRRMALSLVAPPLGHPAHAWAKEHLLYDAHQYQVPFSQEPLYPNITLDDTTIHFRGGDLLQNGHQAYGFLRFDTYKRFLIDHPPKSIGLITQTFGTTGRKADRKQGDWNRILVTALSDYLQEVFPKTIIRIHSEDPMPLSYARMILSNQTIGAFSSFAVYPAMATFGTGYLRHPKGKGPYQWITQSQSSNSIVLFEEPDILRPAVLTYVWTNLGWEVLLQWFRAELTTEELKGLVVEYETANDGLINETSQ